MPLTLHPQLNLSFDSIAEEESHEFSHRGDLLNFYRSVIAYRNKKEASMADQNIDCVKGDVENAYSTPGADPKNMQEVTQYVQSLLQNMQDKFQSMSDQIINRIDEMGTRVDELEKTVTDLMTQAGIENEK